MDKTALLYLQNRVAYGRDHTAYKQLYLYFHPAVFKLAHIIIKEEALAEEVASDVMIRIWTMETKLAYVENLKPYIFAAARNTALTYLKKNKELQTLEIDENCERTNFENMPEQQLAQLELSKIIDSTVNALPTKCQLAYRLIKEEGLSYKEACQVLQISQKTLETHISAALKRLRQTLDIYLLKKKS